MAFLGRIYRIDFADGYFYIGSTKHSLETRLKEHKYSRLSNLKANMEAGYKLRTRFDIYLSKYGWNNPSISLIEELMVSNRSELYQKEYCYISENYHDSKNLNARCSGTPLLFTPEQKQFATLQKIKYLDSWS
jgi:hypothetical protein